VTKIGDFFSWLLISLLLLWFGGMVFAGTPCTRVHRSAWPVTYTMDVVQSISRNWTTDATKLDFLLWKAKGAVALQTFFEKTVYGEDLKCSK
jgi:hypothetical protein